MQKIIKNMNGMMAILANGSEYKLKKLYLIGVASIILNIYSIHNQLINAAKCSKCTRLVL